uniref:Uncharacterized protein n=1 Tax=Tanacetum cinerariifolium TaxID=118510 RepID=A0A6L2LLM2_TANCI|nr:hypothetical protein [Tanacetum cinerariifolium]
MALLWMAPKSYDSHRDKLLRRVDAEMEHSRVTKQRSLGCSPFESSALISPHVMAADQVITSQDAFCLIFFNGTLSMVVKDQERFKLYGIIRIQ